MPKSTVRRVSLGTTTRHDAIRIEHGPVARSAPPDLSRVTMVRLEMLDWHRAHGADVSLTARHVGCTLAISARGVRHLRLKRRSSGSLPSCPTPSTVDGTGPSC
jgi:hypothetical protein